MFGDGDWITLTNIPIPVGTFEFMIFRTSQGWIWIRSLEGILTMVFLCGFVSIYFHLRRGNCNCHAICRGRVSVKDAPESLRVVAISDTHGLHRRLKLPRGETRMDFFGRFIGSR